MARSDPRPLAPARRARCRPRSGKGFALGYGSRDALGLPAGSRVPGMEIKSHAAAPKDDAFDLEPKPLLPSLGSPQRDPPARGDHPVPRKSDPSAEGIHCESGCVGVPGSRRDLTVGGDLSPGNSSDDRADPRERVRDHDAARIGACALNDFPAGGPVHGGRVRFVPLRLPLGTRWWAGPSSVRTGRRGAGRRSAIAGLVRRRRRGSAWEEGRGAARGEGRGEERELTRARSRGELDRSARMGKQPDLVPRGDRFGPVERYGIATPFRSSGGPSDPRARSRARWARRPGLAGGPGRISRRPGGYGFHVKRPNARSVSSHSAT